MAAARAAHRAACRAGREGGGQGRGGLGFGKAPVEAGMIGRELTWRWYPATLSFAQTKTAAHIPVCSTTSVSSRSRGARADRRTAPEPRAAAQREGRQSLQWLRAVVRGAQA